MDSQKIVHALESRYPDPSLHLDTQTSRPIHKALVSIINPLRPIVLPAVQRNVLREPSASWFAEDRKRRSGRSLEQLETDEGGEKAWDATLPGLDALLSQLSMHKRDDGPFVLGSQVSYGDFFVAGVLQWIQIANEELYQRLVRYDPSFRMHHAACRPWLIRDSY